jgi:hypothetical protein
LNIANLLIFSRQDIPDSTKKIIAGVTSALLLSALVYVKTTVSEPVDVGLLDSLGQNGVVDFILNYIKANPSMLGQISKMV